MSADLHRPTIGQLAKVMNVSRRMVFLAIELHKTGRTDLVAEVESGKTSLHEALRIAKPEKYQKRSDTLKRLKSAWTGATLAERDAFLTWMIGSED